MTMLTSSLEGILEPLGRNLIMGFMLAVTEWMWRPLGVIMEL